MFGMLNNFITMTKIRSLLNIFNSRRSIATTVVVPHSNKVEIINLQSPACKKRKQINKTSFKFPLLFSHGLGEKSNFKNKIAFIDHSGHEFSYGQLAEKSVYLAKEFKQLVGETDGERIAFLCDRDVSFPTTLGATWWAGQIAIPLSAAHPDSMLEYFLNTTSTKLLITSSKHADRLNRLAKLANTQLLVVDYESLMRTEKSKIIHDSAEHVVDNLSQSLYEKKGAVILFTSGTTGMPKGVLLTHRNLKAQVENICGGWEVSENDTMLHVLPLHHTHGLIHAMLSPMAAGASCLMLQRFDSSETWRYLLSSAALRPTIFTAVPTVFVKLIQEYDHTFANDHGQMSMVRKTCQDKMRLFLSGSASLPVPILEKFESISGHRILERYGMTETGLILCNPLLPSERKPGFVGIPLKTVQVAVAEESKESADSKIIAKGGVTRIDISEKDSKQVIGDLLVKGPSVFKEYWGNVEATRKEFTEDGWFKTGDTVEFSEESFKILGRKSVDIIKSGGYKLSALQIETQLLSLKEVKEVAIVGLDDPTWGQKVAALIVWIGNELGIEEFRDLVKDRLPTYARPQVLKSLPELPRNHLGKVNKKDLIKLFL